MSVVVSTMFIPVHDPVEALMFYRDLLGLEVRNDVKRGEFRWVTVGAAGQSVDIVLSQPHGGRSQEDGDALLELITKGSIQAAIFSADDLDATFERIRASETVEVLQEPKSQCAMRRGYSQSRFGDSDRSVRSKVIGPSGPVNVAEVSSRSTSSPA